MKSLFARIKAAAAAAAVLALIGACASGDAGDRAARDVAPAAKPRPDVLLIMADDLGYSDIGAYGGEVPTPNLDRLASEGRLLTSHYVLPTCSPTRAALMSGTDHHIAGLGTMAETLARAPQLRGRPGYEGFLNERVNWLPQLMRDAGYHTYMAGKWHLGRERGTWPIDRGFESSFALLQGGAPHFAPVPGKPISGDRVNWVEDGAPAKLPQDFYSSNTITDKLIEAIRRNHADGKPIFAYAAYTAPHWPLQAPDEDIAKFKGRYDAGYEAIRTARLASQKALGVIPPDFKANPGLTPSKDYPTWQALSPADRQKEARKMEVYAAMVHNMDRNIGRLIQTLKDLGRYDNTLIVFMSDNGAEPSDSFFPNNENTDNSLENIGRRLSNVGYGARWAEVSATPFRLFKGWTGEGGIASATIVRMPGQTAALPKLTVQTHVTDIAPTILDLARIDVPRNEYKGRAIHAMTGSSLSPALSAPVVPASFGDRVVAGELFGGRYVRDGRWKAVSLMAPFGDNAWELYDLSNDRGEARNLATTHPDVLRRMVERYDTYEKATGMVFAPNASMPDTRYGRPALPPGTRP
jgi:arylsulfatase A-like enzyme